MFEVGIYHWHAQLGYNEGDSPKLVPRKSGEVADSNQSISTYHFFLNKISNLIGFYWWLVLFSYALVLIDHPIISGWIHLFGFSRNKLRITFSQCVNGPHNHDSSDQVIFLLALKFPWLNQDHHYSAMYTENGRKPPSWRIEEMYSDGPFILLVNIELKTMCR